MPPNDEMWFLQQIDDWAERAPARLAHVHRYGQLTYLDLKRRSDALACFLLQALPGDRQPILVYGHKQSEMLVAFLACLKSGHPYVPVDSNLPVRRSGQIVDKSGGRLILSVAELPPGVTAERVVDAEELHAITRRESGRRQSSQDWITPNENVYIMYTSGSTGEPKGVQITGACLASFVSWATGILPLDREEHFLNQAPFSFDLSVTELYLSLINGGTLFSVDRELSTDLPVFLELLREWRISTWVSTPSFAELCLMSGRFSATALSPIKTFVFCGEPLVRECARQLLERFPGACVINSYGPTEATVFVTSVEIDDQVLSQPGPLPLGRVKPDCEIVIVDPGGSRVQDGAKGEIVIVGPSVSPGYYRDSDRTGRSFYDAANGRAYRTGDAGYQVDGQLFFAGRIDLQVKLRGHRVELEDVEDNLRALSPLTGAVVLPVTDEHGRCESLVAAVSSATAVDVATIKAGLRARVPEYMVPGRIVALRELPLTANGKLDRTRVQEILDAIRSGSNRCVDSELIAPRNEVEAKLAAIWSDILGTPTTQVGIDDSFFELGGDSLSVVELLSRLSDAYGLKSVSDGATGLSCNLRSNSGELIRIADLLSAPTVRAVADLLSGAGRMGSARFEIRPYVADDGPRLRLICQDSTADTPDPLFLESPETSPLFFLDQFLQIEPESCFVATLDGAAVGYVAGTRDYREFIKKAELYYKTIFKILTSEHDARRLSPSARDNPEWGRILRSCRIGVDPFSPPPVIDVNKFPATSHFQVLLQHRQKGIGLSLLEHFWTYLRTNDVSGYFDGVKEKIGREQLWPLLQRVAAVEELSTEVWRATGSSLEHEGNWRTTLYGIRFVTEPRRSDRIPASPAREGISPAGSR